MRPHELEYVVCHFLTLLVPRQGAPSNPPRALKAVSAPSRSIIAADSLERPPSKSIDGLVSVRRSEMGTCDRPTTPEKPPLKAEYIIFEYMDMKEPGLRTIKPLINQRTFGVNQTPTSLDT